ncbi:hypothetical protein E1B28_001804 [Marasmius oreades]|uniref:G-alpha-domain-containing protein n=1 Tax=Marasmius oreades TaxID=181124 RepID=A0A9P8AFT5_9AGAR|nr:uncharacterized protein E1B28_001804 [Marasmius oreades]KAG7100017.1 hypothetical protein E1B28_001804 [Marasmius oreades]
MARTRNLEGGTRRRSLSDPLAAAMLPPTNETPEQKQERIRAENEAKRISDGIDEMIRQERNEMKKTRSDVSVLLLGQSESGKSTTLKQFQLMHSPSAFHAERIAWRAVIYLNLVKSITRILIALSPDADIEEQLLEDDSASISADNHLPIASKYESYRQRLQPLFDLEERLSRLLSSPDEDEPTQLGPQNGTWVNPTTNGHSTPIVTRPTSILGPSNRDYSQVGHGTSKKKELSVHTSKNWKGTFSLSRTKNPKSKHTGEIEGWWENPDDPVHVLNACAPVMLELWQDHEVRMQLAEKKIRLQESAGFYLDEIPRVTAKKYIPTDADVLKARLKTMGVLEYPFLIANGAHRGVKWKIYDVGGARNQRHAWAPYFESVNAIIFLAPISVFDQVLDEDRRVNRLEDSLLLWKGVVQNKLLANVSIVLFLNKCDLLRAKLEAGVRLADHMITYGNRPNTYDSVSKYMRNKFSIIHESYTPNKQRELYPHFTSVTDTRRTAIIIADVRDIILKGHLKSFQLV